VYADPVQKRVRWKLVAVEARKRPNNGRKAAKSTRRRLTETTKNTETDRKVIQQNTKTNTGMEEVREEEKGLGAPSLGTSSKLLEPNAKGTWGGGMAHPPSLLPCNCGVLGGGWQLAEAKKPYLLAILRYNISEFEAMNSLLYSLDVKSKLLGF
jgi:hypothetical protein